MNLLQINETIVNVLAKSTRDGLAMAGVKPVPVGISRYPTSSREVSAIVGLVGQTTNGAIMVSASKAIACFLTGKLLGEEITELNPQVLDGMCEIANIISGQSKALLSTTEWKAEKISCPSVVVGSSYFVSHYKGMTSAAIDFEMTEMPITTLDDRLLSVSVSMMKI